MGGPTSVMRMSFWPWAATRPRTTRWGSASSWTRSGIATPSSCASIRASTGRRPLPIASSRFAPGTDIAFLGGLIQHALTREPVPRGVRAPVHERLFPRVRGLPVRRSGRRVLRLGSRSEDLHQQVELELRAGRARLRARRSDAAASAIGLPGDEEVLRPLHAGNGVVYLRLQSCRLSGGGRAHHIHIHAGSRGHDHVRPRVDAPQPLGAAHSRGGHAAAAAREHRPARRRTECAARPREHPGRHRLRDGVSQPARLHSGAEGRSRSRSTSS